MKSIFLTSLFLTILIIANFGPLSQQLESFEFLGINLRALVWLLSPILLGVIIVMHISKQKVGE